MDSFAGPATRITSADIAEAAREMGVTVGAVQAVLTVETGRGGGFLPDTRPAILFEAQHFHRLTGGAYDASDPTISSPTWNPRLYRVGAGEYVRLDAAVALDRAAALQSTSWGLFQILGSNFADCGFGDVERYVAAMCQSEHAHLAAFTHFVMRTGMVTALRMLDWAGFAERYNGPSYFQNHYDTSLASAYAAAIGGAAALSGPWVIGMVGPTIELIQERLGIAADGNFGAVTDAVLRAWQSAHGLTPDGIAGRITLSAMGIGT